MSDTGSKPRILFVSGELIAGNLAVGLKEEGCEVRLFIAHPEQQQCLDGLVQKTNDWKGDLEWVGKEGLIIFDDVGYGKEQDDLRAQGYRVVGGSAETDRLEQEREYGDKMFRACGIDTVPILNFADPREAIEHVKKNPQPWVVKQNTHQSALNYVGILESGEDVISVLENYAAKGVRNVTLQRKLRGIEVSINRYFNGEDWVGPAEITVEHKSLFNDEIGPKTGEMGNLMWYDSGKGKLFDETLGKLKHYLRKVNFRGDIDINSFVDGDRLYPIEFTSRFGCPITYSQSVMHISPWHEFLYAVASGRQYDLRHHDGYCIALTLALPPFPYEGALDPAYTSDGLEVFFKESLSDEEKKNIHYEGVYRSRQGNKERIIVAKSIGYTMFVTGRGATIEEARQAVYGLAKKIVIPKMFYRTDIGIRFDRHELRELQSKGWV